ncbi:hypothetical protein BXZ70DRAFT_904443 [Cristinia sonorae]|uniref:F-box domain-containing protein n=1 Tax=Cristinia sonorae TaxID=1940300 RepID=A0A8K0UUS8_9AGAR|nr:hypothetical protein BXZ70DRAFT_904443 [Cristinia sonorae]
MPRNLAVPFILSLPPELLIEVLLYLPCRDLLRAGLACRQLRTIVKGSLELKYNIELAADDMIDGPRGPGTLTTSQRYHQLLQRRQRWRTLDWTQQINVPVLGSCQAYELVGGMFAKSMGHVGTGGSRHLITTWLPSSTKAARSAVRDDLGVPTRDFAIDPSQDLIALVNVDDSPTPTTTPRRLTSVSSAREESSSPSPSSIPSNVRIRVHLRTISTNAPHKAAAKAVLQTPVPFQIGNCFIQIVHDVVGMFFWLHGPGLIIWNWRKGETLVACLPQDDRPLGHTPMIPQQPTITSELPPGTWDFAFLSNRAYVLSTIGGRGSIEIYSIEDDDNGGERTVHVASLMMPDLKGGVGMHHFTTHSPPLLGGDLTKDKPFATSQDNRVHLMSFHYGQQGPRFHLFLKNSFLFSFVKNYDGQRKTLRWDEWGPDNTRFLEHSIQFQWLRYVHGQRVVLPPLPVPNHPNVISRLCVLDFNVHPKRIDDPCGATPGRHGGLTYEVFDEESFIPAGTIFENDVVSRLPYSVASKLGRFGYSGFLIDEERLIGMKLSMAFAEGDLSDIDVFTF